MRYVIGDIHGCKEALNRLLERIGWLEDADELWLVGDLVNRGPRSLATLRWAHEHRRRLRVVLGNHDIHLLARWAGVTGRRAEDALSEVLEAPDADLLLNWLRRQPLIVHDGDQILVHAGFHPRWDLETTLSLAAEISENLGGDDFRDFLARLYERNLSRWTWDPGDPDHACAAAAILTRVRMVDKGDEPMLAFTGEPDSAPDGAQPWFRRSAAVDQGVQIFFGHWAQLGFHREANVVCLDSACVYGGGLSAIRIDDGRTFFEPADGGR